MSLEIIGVENFPIIEENDDLSRIICDTLNYNNIKLEDDDVLVLAETVVSKAEGNYVKIEDVVVSDKAKDISLKSGKDAKQCQIILDNTKKIIRCQTGLIITETPHGFICANSGIDNSNCREGYVTPLPVDADRSARCIKKYLDEVFDVDVSVIISDTQGRPWRVGAVGVAIGISGIHPCTDFRGSSDLYGQELMSTIEGTADEASISESIRDEETDVFR